MSRSWDYKVELRSWGGNRVFRNHYISASDFGGNRMAAKKEAYRIFDFYFNQGGMKIRMWARSGIGKAACIESAAV